MNTNLVGHRTLTVPTNELIGGRTEHAKSAQERALRENLAHPSPVFSTKPARSRHRDKGFFTGRLCALCCGCVRIVEGAVATERRVRIVATLAARMTGIRAMELRGVALYCCKRVQSIRTSPGEPELVKLTSARRRIATHPPCRLCIRCRR